MAAQVTSSGRQPIPLANLNSNDMLYIAWDRVLMGGAFEGKEGMPGLKQGLMVLWRLTNR